MGNETQKSKNGEVVLSIDHPRFKNAKIVSEGGRRQVQTSMGIDQKEYEKWRANLKQAKLESNFLLLPRKQEFSRKGLCGNSGTLQLNFDNYSYLLTEEIQNRSARKSKFEQWELWSLLLGLSAAQQEMRRRTEGKVGDIRPQNVFLNAQGQMKVACLLSWPREQTNFSKTFDNERTYLAPEEMVKIQMGNMQDSSSYKAEVFSIGMTVLSAAMLDNFLKLYDTKHYRFDSQQAENNLNEWRSNTVYSEIFTGLVSNLCQFKPEKRLSDQQLWQWISQYEREIMSKQDFVIESAPAKVQQQLDEIRMMFPEEQQPQVFNGNYVQQSYIPAGQQYLPASRMEGMQRPVEVITRPPPGYAQNFQYNMPQNMPPNIQPSYMQPPNMQPSYMQSPNVIGNRVIMEPQREYQPLSPDVIKRTIGDQPYKQFKPLAEHQLPPEVRQQIRQARQRAQQNALRPGEVQGQPQFVGRTVSETYQNPSQQMVQGQMGVRPMSLQQGNLAYYQNIVNPQGNGRFEQTVYIQRPQRQE